MKRVEAAVIGVGWVGGTRAETLARTALVDKLHLCEIRPDRLAEVKALWKPATATLDYNDIINNPNISVVYVSTTPETNHYPICRDCLKAGKNVMLEKPISLELWEADELIQLAKRNNLKFIAQGAIPRYAEPFPFELLRTLDFRTGINRAGKFVLHAGDDFYVRSRQNRPGGRDPGHLSELNFAGDQRLSSRGRGNIDEFGVDAVLGKVAAILGDPNRDLTRDQSSVGDLDWLSEDRHAKTQQSYRQN